MVKVKKGQPIAKGKGQMHARPGTLQKAGVIAKITMLLNE